MNSSREWSVRKRVFVSVACAIAVSAILVGTLRDQTALTPGRLPPGVEALAPIARDDSGGEIPHSIEVHFVAAAPGPAKGEGAAEKLLKSNAYDFPVKSAALPELPVARPDDPDEVGIAERRAGRRARGTDFRRRAAPITIPDDLDRELAGLMQGIKLSRHRVRVPRRLPSLALPLKPVHRQMRGTPTGGGPAGGPARPTADADRGAAFPPLPADSVPEVPEPTK